MDIMFLHWKFGTTCLDIPCRNTTFILRQAKASPHTVALARAFFTKFGIELLSQPSYRPDVAPPVTPGYSHYWNDNFEIVGLLMIMRWFKCVTQFLMQSLRPRLMSPSGPIGFSGGKGTQPKTVITSKNDKNDNEK